MSPRLAVLPAEARPQLPRIVALSATFTIHVVGFALLAMPISRPIESFEREVDSPMVWIEAPPKPEPLPAVPIPPTIKKTKARRVKGGRRGGDSCPAPNGPKLSLESSPTLPR